MSWQELYQQRRMTAEQAVSHIRSGDRMVVARATDEPSALIDVMVKNANTHRSMEIVHMVTVGKGEYCLSEYTENFRHNNLFLGASARDAVVKERGDFTPVYSSQIPNLLHKELHPNMTLLHLFPLGEHGYYNYGVSMDYTESTTEAANLRIAQINPNIPRTLDDSFIHMGELDYTVKVDDPTIELGQAEVGETECTVGEHRASLIQDGSCLQSGIGTIPDVVLLFLKEKKDLGIHSEMSSDGMARLVEADVAANRRKTLHKGQCIVTFLMGSKRLYDYVSSNPSVTMYPVDYVNSPAVVAKNDDLVSVNSCIQVDLTGQVVSDSIGPWQFSGVGGQVDFVHGANLSCGGKSITTMPSSLVKRDGTHIFKIAVQIDAGTVVTTSRYDVNYIVTEFGVAKLKGKTLCDRARTLIEVVHPDFREELMEESHRRLGMQHLSTIHSPTPRASGRLRPLRCTSYNAQTTEVDDRHHCRSLEGIDTMTHLEQYNQVFMRLFGTTEENLPALICLRGNWDPLQHIEMITMTEGTFNIFINSVDVILLNSYEKGEEILRKCDVEV